MIETGLRNKVVLVTGANHGIGAATARAFAAEGAAVFITYLSLPLDAPFGEKDMETPGEALYRSNQARSADKVVQDIRDNGGRVEAWEADLSDPETVPQLFDRVEKAFGPVDVLVNNAAHWEPDTFAPLDLGAKAQSVERWSKPVTITPGSHDRHFAVNSRGVALMMAEYARRHVQRGACWGRIINISTDGAYCFPSDISYGASKLALEAYSRSAATELGRYGITVNIVSPGPIQTGYITPESERDLVSDIPMGRVGQPEDIADAIVFFASERARWITGQLLYVGGGHSM
ncbi:SDR family NAD(P)-dependent oxidoreductase [Candidatus Poribacteria bacterium]